MNLRSLEAAILNSTTVYQFKYAIWTCEHHIDFPADEVGSMVITWVTVNRTESVVEYGPGALSFRASGSVAVYRDGGSEHRVLYMHRVTLTQLKPQQRYGE